MMKEEEEVGDNFAVFDSREILLKIVVEKILEGLEEEASLGFGDEDEKMKKEEMVLVEQQCFEMKKQEVEEEEEVVVPLIVVAVGSLTRGEKLVERDEDVMPAMNAFLDDLFVAEVAKEIDCCTYYYSIGMND